MAKVSTPTSWLEPTGSTYLGTVVMTDLVDSTRLVSQLGDAGWSRLSVDFDGCVRKAIGEHGGFELERTDGFLVLFERPISAVLFASAIHERVERLGRDNDVELRSRVGIHLGELILRRTSPEEVTGGAKAIQADGIAIPTIARVAGLAVGGQTLLTRGAFDLARRASTDLESLRGSQWVAHGPYRLHGLEDPVEIFECCLGREAQPTPPPGSPKAIRLATPDDAPVLGWRPAPGGYVPGDEHWLLVDRLGVGGFGEVWLCEHHKTGQKRVRKFCFNADRMKGLRREVTLFRLLNGKLGERADIARILDWNFEEPPFYIESEYSEEGSITDYAERIGGFHQAPTEQRLRIAEQTAIALAAAHSVGILHKDLKPSNVLLRRETDGSLRAVLTDFGIGLLMDPQLLEEARITGAGFTETLAGNPTSTRTGTRLFMAPELLEGKEASVASDLYAMGVFLYQMIVGDPNRALTIDWESGIKSPSLRELLRALLSGEPHRRPHSAIAVAQAIANHRARDRAILARRIGGGMLLGGVGLGAAAALLFLLGPQVADRGPRLETNDHMPAVGTATVSWWGDYDLLPMGDNAYSPVAGVSNNGRYVAVAGQRLWLMDRELDNEFRPIDDASNGFTTVSFAPNSQLLASAEYGGRVDVRTLPDGGVSRPLPGHRTKVHDIAFGMTGSTLAACSEDGFVRVWDSTTGKRLALYSTQADGRDSWISRVAIDPTESFLAIGHASGRVFGYDLREPTRTDPILNVTLGKSGVVGLAFDPGGTRLVAGTNDSLLAVLDFPSGDIVTSTTLNIHHGFQHATRCTSVRYLPGGEEIAVAVGPARANEETLNSLVLLVDAESHRPRLAAESGRNSWGTRFSENGRFSAAMLNGKVLVSSLQHESIQARTLTLPLDTLVSLHSTGDGLVAANGNGTELVEVDLQSLRTRSFQVRGGDVRFAVVGGGEAPNLFLGGKGALANKTAIHDAPAARLLALNGRSGAATYGDEAGLVLWRRDATAPFMAVGDAGLRPGELFVSPEGGRALVADDREWNMYSTGWAGKVPRETGQSALAASWTEELTLVGYKSGEVAFLTSREGRRVGGSLVYPSPVAQIRTSTDGGLLTAVLHDDETVLLWNERTFEPVARLRGEWQSLVDLCVVGDTLALLDTPNLLHLVPIPKMEIES